MKTTFSRTKKIFIPFALLLFPAMGIYIHASAMNLHVSLFDLFILMFGIGMLVKEGLTASVKLFISFLVRNKWLFLMLLILLMHTILIFVFISNLQYQLYLRDAFKIGLFIISIFVIEYTVRKEDIDRKDYLVPMFLVINFYYFISHKIIFAGFESVSWFFMNTDWAKITIMGHTLVLISIIMSDWYLNVKQDGKYWRVVYLVISAITFLALLLMVRSMWILCLVLITLSTLITTEKASILQTITKLRLYYVVLFVSLAGILLIIVFSSFNMITIKEILLSLTSRLQLWEAAVTMIYDSFPLGVGLGQFSIALKQVFPDSINFYVHNQLLAFIVEMGLLGVIIDLVLLYGIFKITKYIPFLLRASVMFFVVASLLTHDALGIRSFYVLVSYLMIYSGRSASFNRLES